MTTGFDEAGVRGAGKCVNALQLYSTRARKPAALSAGLPGGDQKLLTQKVMQVLRQLVPAPEERRGE